MTLFQALVALVALAAADGATTSEVDYNDTADGTMLKGFVAIPTGASAPLPVVMHVHAWTGLSDFEKGRATRTADEYGLIGFAASVFSAEETARTLTGSPMVRAPVVQKYLGAPAMIVTRLKAAMMVLMEHPMANASHVVAAGYCFGGSAVLHFAKLGGAAESGVMGVFSFHGGLAGFSQGNASFGGVHVAIANGAADPMIPMAAGSEAQAYMTSNSVMWDFATYGHANHGFTHPSESGNHFHYERVAESRSWESLRDFLGSFHFLTAMTPAGNGITTQHVRYMDGNIALSGYLAFPTGATGPLPVVMHVHTWAGLSDFEMGRANRTAMELGHIGFAVSVYTDEETASAQASFQNRGRIAGSYTAEHFASRLSAAVTFLRSHSLVDINKVGAAGYCFGGSAVLHYARLGAAAMDGVKGVASFHGGMRGLDAFPKMYCPTRVGIFNGAGDPMITDSQITMLSQDLETSQTYWEFTNYSGAQHGFTHPSDGSAHFMYDQRAEQRSWFSMADFFNTTFAGEGVADSSACVHHTGPMTTTLDVIYSDTTDNTRLHGFLALPAMAAAPLPVVMHVHAWTGLSDFEKERATRTANEYGVIGFAASVYSVEETATTLTGTPMVRGATVQRYLGAPATIANRLKAAVMMLANHPMANASMIVAVGYCFGGSAVLHFAKMGMASEMGVHGVFSFHGGLSGLTEGNASFGDVHVAIANGAADPMIPMTAGTAFQSYMTSHSVMWDFATYGHANHGFTHPSESGNHFHYERVAESRSWESMRDFLGTFRFLTAMTPAGNGITTQHVKYMDGNISLSGYLAYPTGASGPLPVVMHVHTWAGLSDFEMGRANRTAMELGHIGFAVSVYTDEETASAQASFQNRGRIAGSYTAEHFASRLSAAVTFLRSHSLVDISKVGAAGYCFGGSAVLHYARLGAAAMDGVKGVASFHGGMRGLDAFPKMYCPTRVGIFNGAGDPMITDSQITMLSQDLETSQTYWEFTNYSGAQHGFTHPADGSAHFMYDQRAEQRSWFSMADFFNTTFAGQGMADSAACVHHTGPATTTLDVIYSDADGTRLSGFLALPAMAAAPLPVVMHVHAWTGLSDFEKERATRTANEYGVIGFAASVYSVEETATTLTGTPMVRSSVVQRYLGAPATIASRLKAAVMLLANHPMANASRIVAVGYCFGGSAVLHFAKMGMASQMGVDGVFSFHGGLSGLAEGAANFGNVHVAIANGAADPMIPMAAGSTFQSYMTEHSVMWDFTTYGHANHGFTHPSAAGDHFHYEKVAEARSWESLRDFLGSFQYFTAMTSAGNAVTTQDIKYPDGDIQLSGYLAYPTGATGPLPVVMHVHTWGGLTDFEKGRARRTAEELGYIGFAVSVYTDEQTASAQASFQNRPGIAMSYTAELFASRLSAAAAYLKSHSLADSSKIGAAGYCFGGTAVLQYARLGKAAMDGVKGVASFHGGMRGLDAFPKMYCPTRVGIFNGAGDGMITDPEITMLSKDLETSQTYWEFTNYSGAQHGFTHPMDGSAHFMYDQRAEQRSWFSMADFFNTTFMGEGVASTASCVHDAGPSTTAMVGMDSGSTMDMGKDGSTSMRGTASSVGPDLTGTAEMGPTTTSIRATAEPVTSFARKLSSTLALAALMLSCQ